MKCLHVSWCTSLSGLVELCGMGIVLWPNTQETHTAGCCILLFGAIFNRLFQRDHNVSDQKAGAE